MAKFLCRTIKALDLCTAEMSPGDRFAGSVLIAASAGSSQRKKRLIGNTVSSHCCTGAEPCQHAEPQAQNVAFRQASMKSFNQLAYANLPMRSLNPAEITGNAPVQNWALKEYFVTKF